MSNSTITRFCRIDAVTLSRHGTQGCFFNVFVTYSTKTFLSKVNVDPRIARSARRIIQPSRLAAMNKQRLISFLVELLHLLFQLLLGKCRSSTCGASSNCIALQSSTSIWASEFGCNQSKFLVYAHLNSGDITLTCWAPRTRPVVLCVLLRTRPVMHGNPQSC